MRRMRGLRRLSFTRAVTEITRLPNACIHVHIYIYTYVCMYVCMYMYTHTHMKCSIHNCGFALCPRQITAPGTLRACAEGILCHKAAVGGERLNSEAQGTSRSTGGRGDDHSRTIGERLNQGSQHDRSNGYHCGGGGGGARAPPGRNHMHVYVSIPG